MSLFRLKKPLRRVKWLRSTTSCRVFYSEPLTILSPQAFILRQRTRASPRNGQLRRIYPTACVRFGAVDRIANPPRLTRATARPKHPTTLQTLPLPLKMGSPLLPRLRNPLQPPPIRPTSSMDLGLRNPQEPTGRPGYPRPDHSPGHLQRYLPNPRKHPVPSLKGRHIQEMD